MSGACSGVGRHVTLAGVRYRLRAAGRFRLESCCSLRVRLGFRTWGGVTFRLEERWLLEV